MIHILLLAWLLLVWWGWIVACAAERAVSDAHQGVPTEKRRGVSVFPGFPLFALLSWGAALLIDRFAAPAGSLAIAGLHLLFGVVLCFSIVRNKAVLKTIPLHIPGEAMRAETKP